MFAFFIGIICGMLFAFIPLAIYLSNKFQQTHIAIENLHEENAYIIEALNTHITDLKGSK